MNPEIVEMKTEIGIDVSWDIVGDEIVVESNVLLDREKFNVLFPEWIFDALDS